MNSNKIIRKIDFSEEDHTSMTPMIPAIYKKKWNQLFLSPSLKFSKLKLQKKLRLNSYL
jgi:hypothetical protein